MTIVELGADAADAAVSLWTASDLTRPWNDPYGDFSRAVDSPASAVLGMYDSSTLVGTAMVGVDGHRGWVYYLASHPERRGEGIGRALMAAAERWVEARGMPKIQLMVRRANTVVVDFYTALGYAEQDCVVLGRRFDGSLGGSVTS